MEEYDRQHISDILAGDGNWFTAHLLRLIAKADMDNRKLLSNIYPDEVDAVNRFQEIPSIPISKENKLSEQDALKAKYHSMGHAVWVENGEVMHAPKVDPPVWRTQLPMCRRMYI